MASTSSFFLVVKPPLEHVTVYNQALWSHWFQDVLFYMNRMLPRSGGEVLPCVHVSSMHVAEGKKSVKRRFFGRL